MLNYMLNFTQCKNTRQSDTARGLICYNLSIMKNQVSVISIQICPKIGYRERNLNKVKEIIEKNLHLNPDLIVLPEFFNTGVSSVEFKKLAERDDDSPTIKFLAEIAKEHNTYILAGSIVEKDGDKLYNTSRLLDRRGETIAKYRKIHLFDSFGGTEHEYISYGKDYTVAQTDFGKIGLATCFDIRFPLHFTELIKRGAEIIILPAAWVKPHEKLAMGTENWKVLNRARAVDNISYFISSGLCGKIDSTKGLSGHSMIVDPAGKVLADAGEDEGIASAILDMNIVREMRSQFDIKRFTGLTE